jgi:hypothetical protein
MGLLIYFRKYLTALIAPSATYLAYQPNAILSRAKLAASLGLIRYVQ